MSKRLHGRTIVTLSCPYCGKVFSGDATSSSVRGSHRRHLLVHTGERPFKCIYCGAGFTNRHNMRRHIRLVHPDKVTPMQGPQPTPTAVGEEMDRNTTCAPSEATTVNDKDVTSGTNMSSSHAVLSTSCALPPTRYRTEGQWRLRCKHCGRAFKRTDTHALHERSCTHHNNRTVTRTCTTNTKTSSAASTTSQEKGGVLSTVVPSTSSSVLPPTLQLPESTHHSTSRFTCPDCELEVSSRAGLKMHMRYTCPFREDAFADPLRDAMRHAQDTNITTSDRSSSSSDEERRCGRRLAEQTGLPFYEDANRSSSDVNNSSITTSNSECHQQKTSSVADVDDAMFDSEYWQRYVQNCTRHRRGQRGRRRILLKRLRATQQQQEEEQDGLFFHSASDEDGCSSNDDDEEDNTTTRHVHLRRRRRTAQPLQHVCPFDSCQQSFRTRRQWLAHVVRCHPTEYARLQAAQATTTS